MQGVGCAMQPDCALVPPAGVRSTDTRVSPLQWMVELEEGIQPANLHTAMREQRLRFGWVSGRKGT